MRKAWRDGAATPTVSVMPDDKADHDRAVWRRVVQTAVPRHTPPCHVSGCNGRINMIFGIKVLKMNYYE